MKKNKEKSTPKAVVEEVPDPTVLKALEEKYIQDLRKQCQLKRNEVHSTIKDFLLTKGPLYTGNGYQRQLRELSWSYAALKNEDDVPRLKAAASVVESYQFTHLINAFLFSLIGSDLTIDVQPPVNMTPPRVEVMMEGGELEMWEAQLHILTMLLGKRVHMVKSPLRDATPNENVLDVIKECRELLKQIIRRLDDNGNNNTEHYASKSELKGQKNVV